ncbi:MULTISPECIES: glycosyltransferase 87 family protein [unclassified Saccharothrix]|uniref:glycosyltransferase 87 family protein n=1 Tax=unclassified Saccharothrix TaxID=2593673 RepID=UPI00307CFA33
MLQRRPTPITLTRSRVPVAVIAASLALYVVQAHVWPLERWFMYDLDIYRQGGQAVLDGAGLYTSRFNGQPFTNTPFSALLFAGFALAPMEVARLVMAGLTIAALACSVWCAGRMSGRGLPVAAGVFAVALWLEPVQSSLTYGQVNVVLMALVLLDFRGHRWQGVGIGLAAAVKLTPGLFVVYLLLTRRFRAAGVAAATMLATVAVGFAVLPEESSRYWGGVFLQSSRLGGDLYYFGNQSLHALLGRTLPPGLLAVCWVAAVAVVLVVGLRAAVLFHRRGDELAGVLTVALTALLVSPVSWHHHWVWCVPLVVLLGRRAVAVVVLLAAWPIPGSDAFPLPQGLLSPGPFEDLYALLGLVALGWAWHAANSVRRTADIG